VTDTRPPQPPRLPLVYIIGPITTGDTLNHCRRAMLLWDALRRTNLCTPLCPHWSVVQQMATPLAHDTWLAYDKGLLRHVNCAVRMPGKSVGGDIEQEFCEKHDITVFRLDNAGDRHALVDFCLSWVRDSNDDYDAGWWIDRNVWMDRHAMADNLLWEIGE